MKLRIFQKEAASFQTVSVQEINRGLLKVLLKNDTAFTPADIGGSRNFLKGHCVPVMFVDIRNHFFLQRKVAVIRRSLLLDHCFTLAEQNTPNL